MRRSDLRELVVAIANASTRRSYQEYVVTRGYALQIAIALKRGLPREGNEYRVVDGTHEAWPNDPKKDPGFWMLGRDGGQFVLTFVFEDRVLDRIRGRHGRGRK